MLGLPLAKPAAASEETSSAVKAGDRLPGQGIKQVLQAPDTAINGCDTLRGNVLVLEFFATWCAPCVASIPHFNGLVDALHGKPVRFLSITEEPADTVQTFLKTTPLKGWIGVGAEDASRAKALGSLGLRLKADRRRVEILKVSPRRRPQ